MKKRALSLALAIVMMLSLAVTANALTLGSIADMGYKKTAEIVVAAAPDISDLEVSEYATLDSDRGRRKVDIGHIYVGYAVEDGVINADNSNWIKSNTESIVFKNYVSGEGFTALYATGKGTKADVSGKLTLVDGSDGQYASDFTGTGVAIVVDDYAKVQAHDLTIYTEGFVRAAAIVYNGAEMTIKNSSLITVGANPLTEAYDGYKNSANTSKMISPPWVLGIQGGIRTINVLGKKPTLNVIDSYLATGGWGVLSTDGCSQPLLNIVDSTLEVLPESKGGMNSGWELFGYDKDKYGSGYGSYIIGDSTELFYGVNIKGGTYGAIGRGGKAVYASTNGNIDLYNAYGTKMETVEGKGRVSVIDCVYGVMTHANEDIAISYIDGTVVNAEESIFMYRSSGTADFVADEASLNAGNGIILQMIDDDDSTVGGFNPFNSYLYEDAGVPSRSGNETGKSKKCDTVNMTLTNGVYEGDFYNGTGYYKQAPDAMNVIIGEGATVIGDIALTETFHGVHYSEKAVEVLDSYGNDVSYVFLDADYYVTENEADAEYIQLTKFSINQYFMLCHLLNRVYYNGYSKADVVVEDGGIWMVEEESLITSLKIERGAKVYGAVKYNADGTLTLTPADKLLAADSY
ncbi:MAG: hypothetical protein E7430_00665 [Ruminococcaceae bacterium]|nr:hypothetical protein [Oscillospiraceae bacterium]